MLRYENECFLPVWAQSSYCHATQIYKLRTRRYQRKSMRLFCRITRASIVSPTSKGTGLASDMGAAAASPLSCLRPHTRTRANLSRDQSYFPIAPVCSGPPYPLPRAHGHTQAPRGACDLVVALEHGCVLGATGVRVCGGVTISWTHLLNSLMLGRLFLPL